MNEKMRILKLLEEGRLTAEQAIGLMDALEEDGEELSTEVVLSDSQPDPAENTVPYENKMLRVIVDSVQGDKVNVQLPVKIIRPVLKMTGKLPIKNEELQGLDLEALSVAILECLDNEMMGNIVEVSAADGSTVRVFIG